MELKPVTIDDAEFLFDFNRSDDQLDGEPFTEKMKRLTKEYATL